VTALLDKVEDDHGARQADMVLAVVRKMMNWHASRHDDYVSPIARNMNRVKAADRARKRVLEDDELRAVWHACDELSTFGALVKFALLTAQRKEKIATLRWDDIADGVWAIRTEPREKGNAGRLRLPQAALNIIAAQPRIEGNPYVFTGARGAGPFNSFSEWKAQLDAKLPAHLAHWTIHDLRRTARSLLSRAGVRPDISERVMGHAIPGVEGVYDRHRYDVEKAHALQALADLIDRILNPPAANVVPLRAGPPLATPSHLGREAVATST
jgi:integrase